MLLDSTGMTATPKPCSGTRTVGARGYRALIASCGVLMLLAGCASGQGYTARVLQQRLDRQLAIDRASHRASVQNTQDGAVVMLDEPALFDADKSGLNAAGASTVTNVVEALLAPELMQVEVNGSAQTPDDLRASRTETVRNYVETFSLASPVAIAPSTLR